MPEYILETKNIVKKFGNVTALKDISLKVKKGEIHVLCGENGAGKSTLMNIVSGVYPYGSYEGSINYNGEECNFKSIRDSEEKNIAIIHQHLALIPPLSIAENIFIGNEQKKHGIINWDATRAKAIEYMKIVGLKENPNTLIKDLGVGKQQLVEICKAISKDVKLLILDEPTAALNDEESDSLLNLVLEFKKQGITSILISHKLREVTKVCDAITIIRDGQTIETLYKGVDEISENRIIKGMVGRELTNRFPERKSNIGETVFEIKNWNVFDPTNDSKQVLYNINMKVKRGEVLGIAGLMGAGRTELAMSIFGRSYGTKISGNLIKNGQNIKINSVSDAIKKGLSYVSEDRHEFGMIIGQSIKNNITLPSLHKFTKNGAIDENKEVVVAREYKEKLNIKSYNVEQDIGKLSGGNQQKVIFSKWVLSGANLMILDEPTRGIDVGAKYEIYQVINEIVAEGKSVIFISSDMPEILGMCDRVYVMNEGRVVGELKENDITQMNIMSSIMREAKEA
ncbi:MAG: sugar ABC transporter ATP-binding protein [Lachnospiraceae bacterium]|nr:sugar ABC transporter ATP-binding protein [Lachnospiraceae bacterium]